MLIGYTQFGSVKSHSELLNVDTVSWSTNPRCRSFRLRNTGDEDVTIVNGSIPEIISPGQTITYGGYVYSFREENFSFTFAGGGANPQLTIVQDVQVNMPLHPSTEGEIIEGEICP